MNPTRTLIAAASLAWAAFVALPCVGQDADDKIAALTRDQPRPTPVTRPEMKQMLEDMKSRSERIPLPPLSESEQADPDPRATSYEGRLGTLYLPASSGVRSYLNFGGYSPRRNQGSPNRLIPEPDPTLALDYGFKTRLFWIASRANNCQYCLGHQESKLLAVGMLEDQIAALDSDWSAFPPAEQAAFKLARRLTLEPHLLTDADIDECRKRYQDREILEMVLSVAGNNAINRWKEGVGVPQSTSGGNFGGATTETHSYLTATSEPFQTAASQVINASPGSGGGKFVPTLVNQNSQGDALSVSEQLARCAQREPRLPLASVAVTREVLGELAPQGPLPAWMRLLANFPVAGKRQVSALLASEQELQLSPLLRAQLAWVIARQNGAAYSLAEAQRRLGDLGQSAEQIAALDAIDQPAGSASPGEKETALLVVAKNLAAAPVVLTDAQVAEAVRLAGPRDVVQTVHYTALRSLFDRFTEAAGLPADR
jgi:alkylhydroperoxidase family enzyme